MKKITRVACLIIAVLMFFTMTSFAAGGTLKLISSSPKDEAKGASIENVAVKLYFDGKFTSETLKDANADKVKLYDPKKTEFPTKVYYDKKEEGVVLVVLDITSKDMAGKKFEGNTKYKLVISQDFRDDNGNTLGKEETISFTTLNMALNTWVSMGMMIVLFGGMMFFTAKSSMADAEQQSASREEKVNPYKEAKKTGKSVEEIVEKDRRDKEKRAKREAKRQAEFEEVYDEYMDVYKVGIRRSAAASGSRYVQTLRAKKEKKKSQQTESKYNNNKKRR